MTVEQRIKYKDISDLEIAVIYPGSKTEIKVVAVEAKHPHVRNHIIFQASCSEDDTHGIVAFNHPDAGFVEKTFSGDSQPFYMINTHHGLGVIEWEHKPGKSGG